MTNKEYAEILIPNVEHDWEYYEQKYPKRNLKEGAMVTRFAPSPTGFVHMGSLYTSFSDLQFAHQTGGVAYIRIEDTDQKREVENGIEGIIKDFNDLNIKWDEGPSYGGEYGPYIQSERKDIYQAFARKLIEEELAYPCFCSEETLDITRKNQEIKKARIGYYGKYARCRNYSKEQVMEKINNGEKFIIRFKSPGNYDNKVVLNDLIKGHIEMPENDLDIVIIKSDGLPTYHFAHVVDDHLMRTTHVFRGDEWVSSYPIHDQLFKVLGFELPKFGHIAPITIKDNGSIRKLSKRKDPEAAISYYYKLGIPTEVINLYLATVNNSAFEEWYTNNPTLTVDDYEFTFDKMPVGGSLFDIDKLMSISKIYFSRQKSEDIYENLLKYLEVNDPEFYELVKNSKEKTINTLNIEKYIARPRKDIASYSDYKKYFWYMYDELFTKDAYDEVEFKEFYNGDILEDYINNYYNEKDDKDTWFNKIKDLAEKHGFAKEVKAYKANPESYKGHVGDVCELIRVAITSKVQTPDLYEILNVLGKDTIKNRIELFKSNIK
ncbi:MAG: glutamate--tRNA ligase [Bacilli bacterium]|nr:glutamate--tRNA ligase [Bacilli bacterium]